MFLSPARPPRKPYRSAIQLEEALNLLKGAAIAGEKQAAALASGKDEHPESSLAELRARHQACPVGFKSLLGSMPVCYFRASRTSSTGPSGSKEWDYTPHHTLANTLRTRLAEKQTTVGGSIVQYLPSHCCSRRRLTTKISGLPCKVTSTLNTGPGLQPLSW